MWEVIKERKKCMAMEFCSFIFRKTYFFADDITVVQMFSLVEERKIYYKNQANGEYRLTYNTLKTDLKEVHIKKFDPTFIQNINEGLCDERVIISKEKKDKILQYDSLFEIEEIDYKD